MAARSRGPRKLTLVVLIFFVAVTPIFIISSLVLGLQPPNAPPSLSPNTTTTASSSSTSSSLSTSSATVNTITVSRDCQNQTRYSGIDSASPALYNTSTASFPIFSIRPGQSAILCVAWVSSLMVDMQVNVTKAVSIGNYTTHTFANGTTKTIFSPAVGVTVTTSKSLITIGETAGPLLVVPYTITAASESKGFFYMNVQSLFPTGCDNEFRFAVGYTFTDANKTSPFFPLPKGMGVCADGGGVVAPAPPGGIYSQVYSTGGLRVTDLACGSFICDLHQPSN